jgi:hypothetical protein
MNNMEYSRDLASAKLTIKKSTEISKSYEP